jgi:DnaJ-domain-containing protein 1
MTPERAAQRSAVEHALLDFHRAPGKYALIRRQPSVLFASVKDVLQIASGRAPDANDGGAPAADVRKAACFFVRSALLYPDADHYALLGLDTDADVAAVKDRYRQMMRLMHPDFADVLSDANWPTDAATRVNQAYDVLSSPVRRRAYDEARDPPATPIAPQPHAETRAPFRTAPARPPATDPRYRLKQLAVVFGVTGSMALAATLYIGSNNEKESLVQRSREIDAMVAAALPVHEASSEAAVPNPAAAARELEKRVDVEVATLPPPQAAPPAPTPEPLVAPLPAPPSIHTPPTVVAAAPQVLPAAPTPTPAPPPLVKRPELPSVVAPAPVRSPAAPTIVAAVTPPPLSAPSPVPVPVIVAAAPPPAPLAATAVIAPRPAAPVILAAPVAAPVLAVAPAPVPLPAPAIAPAPSPAFAPIPSPAPAPVVVAVAKSATFSPAPGPAAAPVRSIPGVTLAEVHPLLSKLLQQMESGWGDQVLSVLEREARTAPAAQALARNYNALLEGSHRVRLANVQFKAEPREGRLLVVGHVSMLIGEPDPGALPKQFSVQAEFASRDGSVVMTRLAQVDN